MRLNERVRKLEDAAGPGEPERVHIIIRVFGGRHPLPPVYEYETGQGKERRRFIIEHAYDLIPANRGVA
jgi:hypothetical protein